MGEDIRKLDPIMKSLSCKLTQDEILECGTKLASIVQDIAAEEEEQASIKAEMKARLTELESKKNQLALKIQRRVEWRNIEVNVLLDFEDGMYREIRTDTGEVIFEREISDEERQEKLIIEDVDPGAEAAKLAEESA